MRATAQPLEPARACADLFPETQAEADAVTSEWRGAALGKYDSPRVVVRLLSEWDPDEGWCCGWFVCLDTAVDEWHPKDPDAWKRYAQYPWYRLTELPTSKQFSIAAGTAARAVKIVLEQMIAYAADQASVADARQLSSDIERQAQHWLCNAA